MVCAARRVITQGVLESVLQRKVLLYDKAGEEHFNLASALIKSLRGSDPDAAVYWMARMLEAGEPLEFVARRLVIFAAEDVGNADPQGSILAHAAAEGRRRRASQLKTSHAFTHSTTISTHTTQTCGLGRRRAACP